VWYPKETSLFTGAAFVPLGSITHTGSCNITHSHTYTHDT